jgi:hypothetical protein
MIQFFLRDRNRWLILMLVFGVGPFLIYLAFIHPAICRISSYQGSVDLQTTNGAAIDFGPIPAVSRELEQLEEIRQYQFEKLKKIENRESLLHFSGAVADALAFQAKESGLNLMHVDLQNVLIQGKYLPANDHALETLGGLPAVKWADMADPLDLPMLNLPSIEIRMTVLAEYSQVFSFVETLPEFPVLVSLSNMSIINDADGKAFQLNIRCFYYGSEKNAQLAQVETVASN